jgi:hypothetical protein
MPTAAGAKTAFAHEFHRKTDHTMQVILYKKVYELRSASTGFWSRITEFEWDVKQCWLTLENTPGGEPSDQAASFSLGIFGGRQVLWRFSSPFHPLHRVPNSFK